MQRSGRQKVRSRSQVVGKDWEGFPEGLGRTSVAPGGQGDGLRIRPQICHREEQAGTPDAEVWAKRKGVEALDVGKNEPEQALREGRGLVPVPDVLPRNVGPESEQARGPGSGLRGLSGPGSNSRAM